MPKIPSARDGCNMLLALGIMMQIHETLYLEVVLMASSQRIRLRVIDDIVAGSRKTF